MLNFEVIFESIDSPDDNSQGKVWSMGYYLERLCLIGMQFQIIIIIITTGEL